MRIFITITLVCLLCVSSVLAGEDSPHPTWQNLAEGKTAKLLTPPNYPEVTDAGDAGQLVDGRIASKRPIWYDQASVGWMGPEPLEFTIDLGEVQPIRGVAIRSGAGQAGVDWPQEIRLLVSDTGDAYSPLGDLMKLTPRKPPAEGYDVIWLEAPALKTHGRFVKLIVKPSDTGSGVYFFTDEVEIYKGDEAYLKLPLPKPEVAAGASASPELENLARGKAVTLNTAPNDAGTLDAGDARQMVDGNVTAVEPMWNDKATIGWSQVDPTVFTVDLETDQPIRGVAVRVGAGQSGAEWPESVQILVSETGDKFSPVGDLMQLLNAQPPEKGYASFWLKTDKLETHGRYVKIVCTPKNLGNGAYIFMDELEIYRGDDEWLSRPLGALDMPETWRANWQELKWRDNFEGTPQQERPTRVVVIDGNAAPDDQSPLQQATLEKDGVHFTLTGEAGKPRSMVWSANLARPVSTDNCRYAVLSFRAEGIRRMYEVRPIVSLQGINDQSADNSVMLLEANMALNDGRSHTLVTQLPEGFSLQQIKVGIVTEDEHPRLVLERLELVNEIPEIFSSEISVEGDAPAAGFAPAELGGLLNGSLAAWNTRQMSEHKTVIDGVRTLNAGPVMVSGVPFNVASGDMNLALMPESKPSDERIEFLGHPMDRRYLEPESRHDELAVNVDIQAREAFLLLSLIAPPVQRLGGQAHTALKLDDIEVLSVELTYDSGPSQIAFPYSLADQACYIPSRALGAYAVAVDPSRRLKKITLHNRQFGPAFALAALTFNTSEQAIVPELAATSVPEQTRRNADPIDQPVTVSHKSNRLTFKNRWYECEIDLSEGFVIDRYVNLWNAAAPFTLGADSGLRVRIGNTVYTGRSFKSKVMRVSPNSIDVKLTSNRAELPLEINVTISANETPELSFVSETANRGSEAILPELCLPTLTNVAIGDVARTRLFFPQYRAVNTGEPIALRAPYGPEYTTQFMDVYSRPAGVGLMVRTDNAEQQMVDYTLRKDDGGVSGGICFPADYNDLSPAQTRKYVPVSLIAHNGDWRDAVAIYRDWVHTWLKPYRSQDKGYFINAWEIACYRTSIHLSWLEQKAAPFINEARTKFMVDEVYEFEKKSHGHNADLVHFYNWSYNDAKKANDYGVHSTSDVYKHVGGIEFFRKGIDDIQTRLKTPVSLYTVIDRFRASLVNDKALAKELVDGAWHQEPDKDSDASSHVRGSTTRDGTYFVRAGHERWTDFVLSDIIKMQRDTGCKMVYIDVFSFWSHLKGHDGVSPRQADLKVIKRLKEELPPDVALWSEYPVTDVASQWHDGSLQYYFLHLNEVFARQYNDTDRATDVYREVPISIGRYVLPKYKTFGLTAYIEACNSPSQPDAMFVNGEANQEDTWRLHHSRIRQKLNRAYDVKHAYNDCFTSDNPSPQVDTAAQGITANLFPAETRNLWTIYNGRPATYDGVVLEVPHQPGATYRDAWNDKEISPVIENGIAKITLSIDPQQPGCVVQEWK